MVNKTPWVNHPPTGSPVGGLTSSSAWWHHAQKHLSGATSTSLRPRLFCSLGLPLLVGLSLPHSWALWPGKGRAQDASQMGRSQLNAFAWSTDAPEAPLPQPQGLVLTSRRPPSPLAWASCPLHRPSASSQALTSTMSFWWAEFLRVMYMIKASIMVITVAHGKAKIAGCMPGGERGPGHCPGSLVP